MLHCPHDPGDVDQQLLITRVEEGSVLIVVVYIIVDTVVAILRSGIFDGTTAIASTQLVYI